VHGTYEGEARFPDVRPDEWVEVSRETHTDFDFVRYLPHPSSLSRDEPTR